jgi:pilus assembly protein CpaE
VGQATFNALVLMEDSSTGLILGELAADSRQVSILKSLDRVPDTIHEIARLLNSTEPDLVFIDLRVPESALELINTILGHAATTAIVGLSSASTARYRDRFDSAGIAAFLEVPLNLEAFESSVREAIRKVRAGVSQKLIVFLPAKAGSGSTTVALNVAGALAGSGKKTLLIETDLHSGVLSTLLNVTPTQPLVDALARAATLDYSTWTKYVVQAVGLDTLLTDRAKTRPLPSWMNYHQLLRFALGRYDYVVADLPEVINDATEELVRSAHAVLVVCTPELLSLTLARHRLDELDRRRIPAERVHVILNRWHPRDMKPEQAEEFLKHKVVAALPNDYKSVNHAIVEGALVPPDSDLGRNIAALAKWLAGETPDVGATPKAKTSWFGR